MGEEVEIAVHGLSAVMGAYVRAEREVDDHGLAIIVGISGQLLHGVGDVVVVELAGSDGESGIVGDAVVWVFDVGDGGGGNVVGVNLRSFD